MCGRMETSPVSLDDRDEGSDLLRVFVCAIILAFEFESVVEAMVLEGAVEAYGTNAHAMESEQELLENVVDRSMQPRINNEGRENDGNSVIEER